MKDEGGRINQHLVTVETLKAHEWPCRATLYKNGERIRGAFGHTPEEAFTNLSTDNLEIERTWLDWSECEIKT